MLISLLFIVLDISGISLILFQKLIFFVKYLIFLFTEAQITRAKATKRNFIFITTFIFFTIKLGEQELTIAVDQKIFLLYPHRILGLKWGQMTTTLDDFQRGTS